MANNIDLTDDIGDQLALSSSIGRGVGGGIGAMVAQKKRRRIGERLVSTLTQGAAEGWDQEQIWSAVHKIPGIVDTEIGQEMAMSRMGIGRYYQDPADIARAKYYESRTTGDANRAANIKQLRSLVDAKLKVAGQPQEAIFQAEIDRITQMLQPDQQGQVNQPQAMPEVDAITMAQPSSTVVRQQPVTSPAKQDIAGPPENLAMSSVNKWLQGSEGSIGEFKGRELDEVTARKILQAAGGDKEKARQMAKSMGYIF